MTIRWFIMTLTVLLAGSTVQAKTAVLCAGDSITYGYAVSVSYPTRLANNTGSSVVNAGLGGETASHGLSRIDGLLSQNNPSCVLILYGTNDINNPKHNLQDAAYAVLKIALHVRAYGAVPVIGTVPPMVGSAAYRMSRVREMNNYLRSYASANGIRLADIFTAFGSGSGLFVSDGFHPNDSGAEIIAQTFAAKLPILINPSSLEVTDIGAYNQSFSVNASTSWTATADQTWITVTAGHSGVSNGAVYFNVATNTGLARSGTITVAGGGLSLEFTINQDAATLQLGSSYVCLPAAGTVDRQLSVTAHLPWTATANQTWITITAGSAGTGNGTIVYNVATNGGEVRSGAITVSVGEVSCTFNVNQYPVPSVPGVSADGDFDGDGVADLATFQPSTGNWHLQFANGVQWLVPWGWSATVPVPADYDGDGIVDIAVYYPAKGGWYILQSADGCSRVENFGWSSAVPIPGDYDNDGKADLAVFYQKTARWYFHYSGGGADYNLAYGWSAVVPVPADYDGDGQTDLAVYHPASGNWYIFESGTCTGRVVQVGGGKALPIPADYDNDGQTDVAVYTPATAKWQILYSGGGSFSKAFGWSTVFPVPADYDGDGAADLTVYDQIGGRWFILSTTTGTTDVQSFGGSGANSVLWHGLIHSWFGLR